MTDQERNQVLKMIEAGQVSPEEGLKLLQALDQSPAEDEQQESQTGQAVQIEKFDHIDSIPPIEPISPIEPIQPVEPIRPMKPIQPIRPNQEKSNMDFDPRITSIKATVQRLWQIPLWIGIGITIMSAVGMFLILQGTGMNFWFWFMVLPLLLGVLIIVLSVGVHKARWLFVDIHEKEKDGHSHRIFFGFPLPIRFIAWCMRLAKQWVPNLRADIGGVDFDAVIDLFDKGFQNEPMIVNVDEGEGGDRVKVYIG